MIWLIYSGTQVSVVGWKQVCGFSIDFPLSYLRWVPHLPLSWSVIWRWADWRAWRGSQAVRTSLSLLHRWGPPHHFCESAPARWSSVPDPSPPLLLPPPSLFFWLWFAAAAWAGPSPPPGVRAGAAGQRTRPSPSPYPISYPCVTPASSFPRWPPSPWRGRREAQGPVGGGGRGELGGEQGRRVTSGGKEREEEERKEGGGDTGVLEVRRWNMGLAGWVEMWRGERKTHLGGRGGGGGWGGRERVLLGEGVASEGGRCPEL